jgi:hypothetical protein
MLYKTHMTYNDFLLHDIGEVQPDEGKLKKVATLAYLNFEDSVSNRFVPDNTNSFGSNYFYRLSEDEFPVDTIRLGYDKKIFKDAKWFKASGRFLTRCRESYLRHILSVSVIRGDKTIKWKGCVVDNKIGLADKTCNHAEEDYNIYHIDCNLWGRVYYYTAIPDDIKEGDKIELNIWNPFRTEVLIDDIRLEIYK